MSYNEKEDPTSEPRLDNWRQFQGTELGSLLGQIYGKSSRPKINYPKPKARANPESFKKENFIPVNAKSTAVDPRKSTFKKVSVNTPKHSYSGFNSSGTHCNPNFIEANSAYPAVNSLMKRKNKQAIDVEMDDIRMKNEYYRPAHIKAYSSDKEKDRLSQIFTYKGGKALPTELSYPISVAPFELAEKAHQLALENAMRAKRGLAEKAPANYKPPPRALSDKEQLAQQIEAEIGDRTEYLQSMKSCKALSRTDETRLRDEIRARVSELSALEADL